MSKFWLYLGMLLACSGIGTGLGIFLIILYVWGDIRAAIDNNNTQNNESEKESLIEKYFNQSFENEISVDLLLNQKDESIFISDDQPYNEYFLIRRYNDYMSGTLKFVK